MKKAYQPIKCSLHDQLESLALHRKVINVEYMEKGRLTHLDSVIIETTVTKDAEEYLEFSTGQSIRLDYLVLVDGVPFT